MGLLLCIETATKVCSVALSKDGRTIGLEEFCDEQFAHSEKLNQLIDDLLKKCNIQLNQLDAIVISEGPGSYTGLRIGTSAAKGMCYALDIPLIAVNSLAALASLKTIDYGVVIPLFDARRMEVYAAAFSKDGEEVMSTRAVVVESNSFEDLLRNQKVTFIGPGAEKCQAIFAGQDNAIFDLSVTVSAAGMSRIGEYKYQQKDFVDTAYFEPFYLKDFIAGKPKKVF
jgi:tRNA threonylcarbamoyladenosine biosynthesis protein TsaB